MSCSQSLSAVNNKFLDYSRELRMRALEGFGGILLFFNNKVFCYEHGDCKGFKDLDLVQYNVYKTFAHTIILYSEKHKVRYESASDLCPKIQQELMDAFPDEDIPSLTVKELMSKSTELYLSALHKAVQEWKDAIFDGQWPSSLLVIVSGPSSPRFGHPAMQYFSRLTSSILETNYQESNCLAIDQLPDIPIKDDVVYDPLKLDRYIGRKLYYIENPTNFVQAMEIGLSLYVEETIFSQYQSMKTDILSKESYQYLNSKCIRKN